MAKATTLADLMSEDVETFFGSAKPSEMITSYPPSGAGLLGAEPEPSDDEGKIDEQDQQD